MEIIVLAQRFRKNRWEIWKHTCSEDEAIAIVDTALANVFGRLSAGPIGIEDYLAGARYLFNIAKGSEEYPMDGDIRVGAVCLDQAMSKSSFESAQNVRERAANNTGPSIAKFRPWAFWSKIAPILQKFAAR